MWVMSERQLRLGYMCNYQHISQTFISRSLWLQLQQDLTGTIRKLESCVIYLQSKPLAGALVVPHPHKPVRQSWACRKEQIFWNTTGDVFEWQCTFDKIPKLIPTQLCNTMRKCHAPLPF